MSDFLDKTFYGNTSYSWLLSLAIVIGAVILGKILFWFINKIVKKVAAKSKSKIDDIIVDMVEEPSIVLLVLLGFWFAFKRLTFEQSFEDIFVKGFFFVVIVTVTWLIARLLDAIISEYLEPLTKKSESDLDDQLLPIFKKAIRSIVWILGVIIALDNTGFDIGAVLAGLGIGGLALAMAAKDLVSNVFGGITIFTDKPFKIKDRIKIGGFDGTVEEIGIRSTKIRTLEGRVVTVPNAKFTDSMVENVSVEPSRKVVLNLGLIYDTKPDQMQLAMDTLREIVSSHNSTEETIHLAFNKFGDSSLGILLIYYIRKGEDILKTQTDINLAIISRFTENKLEFAYPTQTILTQQIN
jgi:MscS family membrane protein